MNQNRFVAAVLVVVALFGGQASPNPPSSDDEIFLYRAVEKVAPGHFPLDQGAYGTCVAFGHAAACDTLLAIDKLAGKSSLWLPASPDAIYAGSRNEAYQKACRSYGQGSSGYGATRWLNKYGGILYRQNYSDHGVNLTSYEIPRCKDWGATGNGGSADGINGPLDREAAKHPIKAVALVKTLDELDVALKHGWPVTLCSGQGFSSRRDADGFCRAQGSWSHCMVCLGKRNGGRKGYLILNSWGRNWVSGPKYKDQPDGSFYCEPATMARILRAGDSWALSNAEGFKPRLLPSWLTTADGRAPEDPQRPKHVPQPDPISTPPVTVTPSAIKPFSGTVCIGGVCRSPQASAGCPGGVCRPMMRTRLLRNR